MYETPNENGEEAALKRLIYATLAVGIASSNTLAGDLEIVNIRVGQGDATLIKGPADDNGDRVAVLVDGGDIRDRPGDKIIRAVLAKRGVHALDYLIVSHYDADHIGGIVSGGFHGESFLLGWNRTPGDVGDDDLDGIDGWIDEGAGEIDPEEFGAGDDVRVGHFVDRGDFPPHTSTAYRKYKMLAEAHGNRISLDGLSDIEGFEIALGDGARMTALAANGFVRGRPNRVANVTTENERSLSFLVDYGDFHYLISGDLIGRAHGSEDARVESAVGDFIQSLGITVDVLHVNHHGSNNASDEDFLEKIKPTIAVISTGNNNDYKHPDVSVLRRLRNAKVYRIIQTSWGTTNAKIPMEVREVHAIYQNDVVINTDGNAFTISTSRTYATDANPLRED